MPSVAIQLIAGLAISHTLSSLEVLSDQDKRAKYDKFGWAAKGQKPGNHKLHKPTVSMS